MDILVCGGAGYIGSHMVKYLAERGHRVTVFDNLSAGHREAVQWGDLFEGDLTQPNDLKAVFKKRTYNAVMHFSAKSLVGESVADPALYYRNNVIGTINLLEEMRRHSIDKFVFSSSASTFGVPLRELVDEQHPQLPINPYGESKLMVERILRDFATAYGLNSVSLRYFNAAGADLSGRIGEAHRPETHLIPNILRSILDRGEPLKLFGDDYETPDGTCVRDYIHVNDLCSAHLEAIEHMDKNPGASYFNLGSARGFSIKEVIKAVEEVTNCRVNYTQAGRRPGDPAFLVADSRLARVKLGWQTRYSEIAAIIESAWKWHQNPQF